MSTNRDPFGARPASRDSPSRSTFQPAARSPSGMFKPFMPSSSFGQALTAQGTGGSGSQPRSPQPQPQHASAMHDLLGDSDQEQSKRLTNESAELGNITNQMNMLRVQSHETQGRKASIDAELNKSIAQKRDLETRLSQAQSQYEADVRNVKQVEGSLNASREETRKLQQEFDSLEASRRELSAQHQQVESDLAADQHENARLKESIRQTNAEIARLRAQLEKMRSTARQQKGMVAINKKQLTTNENERDGLRRDLDDLTQSAHAAYNRSPEASSPGPPAAGSPALSTASHNTNPFFRRSPQPAENTMSPSGFARGAVQTNFDNPFGPPIASASKSDGTAPAFSAPSGPSGQSSEPDVPTPAISPPLSQYHESSHASEPPAPPANRFGGTGTQTPTNVPASPPPPAVIPEPARDTSAPEPGPSPFGHNFTSSPAVSDEARTSTGVERKDTFQSFGPPSTSMGMPGSFPDVTTPLQPEATGQSDRSKGSFGFPRSDPFASRPQRQGSAAKADFDAAFAGFGSGKQFQERQNTGSSLNGSVGSASRFNQEFPPIKNLHGDDSDSNSEHGFDDNFAPTSPQRKRDDNTAQVLATSGLNEGTVDSVPSDVYHSAQSYPPTDKAASPANQEPAKPPFGDDFDSGFDDLIEARDANAAHALDGHDDDDIFATCRRENPDEFNPIFDSPAASKSNTIVSQVAPTKDAQGNPEESAPSFEHTFANSTSGPRGIAAPGHDWDAIFSGLSDNGMNSQPHDAPESAAAGDAAGKPQLSRALSTSTEHDDPILKDLVSMGYQRNEAIDALEKYNYDISKAVDHLSEK